MIDLATPEDFAAEDDPIYARVEAAEFSGRVLVLVLLACALGTDWYARGPDFWRSLTLALALGVSLGVVVAILSYFANFATRRARSYRRLLRLLAADPVMVAPSPETASHRLLCGLLLPKRRFCGGMLYVTPHGLIFQPHYPRRRPWRRQPQKTPEALAIAPPTSIVLSEGMLVPRPWWRRPLGERPVPLLCCDWEGGMVAFRVPKTPLIRQRLQSCIDALRITPSTAV
jgi:hypothetical protein